MPSILVDSLRFTVQWQHELLHCQLDTSWGRRDQLSERTWEITIHDFSVFLSHRITKNGMLYLFCLFVCDSSPRMCSKLQIKELEVSSALNWIVKQYPMQRNVKSCLSALVKPQKVQFRINKWKDERGTRHNTHFCCTSHLETDAFRFPACRKS